jgi:hypothetical protein
MLHSRDKKLRKRFYSFSPIWDRRNKFDALGLTRRNFLSMYISMTCLLKWDKPFSSPGKRERKSKSERKNVS